LCSCGGLAAGGTRLTEGTSGRKGVDYFAVNKAKPIAFRS
jgi:hypothetical protein